MKDRNLWMKKEEKRTAPGLKRALKAVLGHKIVRLAGIAGVSLLFSASAAQTVLADDPMLTCRIEKSTDRDTDNVRNPIRIVCDSKLRIPEDSQIVQTAGEIETIVATTAAGASDSAKCERLKDKGVSIIEIEDVDGQVDLRQLMTILGGKGIDGILLEGGGELNYSMVSEGLVDEACVFIAPKIFGGEGKYSPVSGTGVDVPADAHMFGLDEVRRFDEDVMLRYKKV